MRQWIVSSTSVVIQSRQWLHNDIRKNFLQRKNTSAITAKRDAFRQKQIYSHCHTTAAAAVAADKKKSRSEKRILENVTFEVTCTKANVVILTKEKFNWQKKHWMIFLDNKSHFVGFFMKFFFSLSSFNLQNCYCTLLAMTVFVRYKNRLKKKCSFFSEMSHVAFNINLFESK